MGSPPKPSLKNLKPLTLPDGRAIFLTADQLDRAWSQISVADDGCWIWTGARLPSGYGRLKIAGVQVYSHRLIYMITTGPIDPGLHTDHLCRNPPCCNPGHLEPVTARENVMRSPIHPAAINARKTHCDNDHPLSGDNLLINVNGGRVCRTCASEGARRSYAKKTGRSADALSTQGSRRPSPDVCINGHALNDTNSYIDPRGTKRCRDCAREQQRRWREKKETGR